MGTILKAQCECGFESKTLGFGAGMEDEGICDVPALKNGSSEIEMKNIRKKTSENNYIFYTDKFLYLEDKTCRTHNAWEFKLQEKFNLCPKCKNYTMKFIYLGVFD